MFASLTDPKLIACVNAGGVVVIPTDTLYGVVARASNKAAVERVYRIRGRAPQKPCIVLVADQTDIIDKSLWTKYHHHLANTYWPGALSLVTPTTIIDDYLHRGTKTLAYRVPANTELRALLHQTGMLIAPSANPEAMPPATTFDEAHTYFGDAVDGYVDGGILNGNAPSTVLAVVDDKPVILRQGVLSIPLGIKPDSE